MHPRLLVVRFRYASRLDEALVMLEQGHTDLVLSDLNVPDSDSINTLLEINRKHPDVAIIIVTGAIDEELGIRTIAAGAQDYLVKGKFDALSLAKSAEYAIERKRTERTLKAQNQFLSSILESLHLSVLRCGRLRLFRRRRQLGRRQELRNRQDDVLPAHPWPRPALQRTPVSLPVGEGQEQPATGHDGACA